MRAMIRRASHGRREVRLAAGRQSLLPLIVLLLCTEPVIGACGTVIGPRGSSEIVVGREQLGTTIVIHLGDTVVIRRPSDFENWQIEFASPPLELLTPPNERSAPGPNGWRFRSISTGESSVTISPITTGDAQPPRFNVTIRVVE